MSITITTKKKLKKAFSLLELLIVILIVGIIYTFAIGSFKEVGSDKKEKLNLQNLKEYLQKNPHEQSVKLLCRDECFKCDILVDGIKLKEIDGFVDKSIEIYRYDFSFGMLKVDSSNDICFSYTIDKKGVGEQIFVEYKSKVYDFSTYLSSTPVYNSLQEASEARELLVGEVLR